MSAYSRWRLTSGAVLLIVIALTTDARSQPVVAPPPRPKPEAGPLPAGAVARIGTSRLKFPGAAIHVAFAPSGTQFVSASNSGPGGKDTDRLVVLWDAVTGKEIRRFKGHAIGVEALAFSTDGKQIVTGGREKIVRLLEVESGKEVRRFTGHTEPILAVAYSPNQKLIASTGQDTTVRIWNAENAKELHRLPGRKSQGTSNLQFSPDGKLLAAVSADNAIRLWNPQTGKEVTKLTGPTVDSLSLDFSRDGKHLAAISADGKLWVWEVETKKELLRIEAHKKLGICVRFSPDGSILATGGGDGLIHFWDATGKLLRSAAGHPANNVSEISFSADGSILASAGHEGTIRLWDVATGLELPQSGGTVTRAALSSDGKRLATAGGDPIVRFWEPTTGKEILPALRIDRPAGALAFSADGRSIITSNSVDELRVWSIENGKEVRKLGSHSAIPVARIAGSSGGRYLASSGSGTSFHLWDTETGKSMPSFGPGSEFRRFPPVRSMAFSPTETRVVIGCGDGKIHLCDVGSGAELYAAPLVGLGPGVSALAWSPDGRTFASVGAIDSSLHLWEAISGRERISRVSFPSPPWAVAFSPDGQLLAVGRLGGVFHLFDARTGKELTARVAHQGAVAFLAFTPDGRYLVTAATDIRIPMPKPPDSLQIGDGTALVWEVAALVKEIPAVPKPTEKEIEGLWKALAGSDPVKAGDAVWRLAADPDLSIPLLGERLPKVGTGEPDNRIAKLLVDLDDDDFDVREKATEELIQIGPSASEAVQKTLKTTKSREVRRRAEEIISRIGTGSKSLEELLVSRGVEVLQRMKTPEARKLLQTWADSPANSPLAREARTALGQTRKSP
ncbi:MAG: WD40 repeat domain-containing protein [Planctomycetia bacterium]|nr:WD40 repeat domain-containing protein [Planctomycetia bacterium]